MLEDQVAYLLQRYLGNYVRGLNKEALKISVWRGDVELTNMQLKPEALNALKLPVKVKAGFLGSVKLKVPWSRLGQEPVLVYLDQIFILAEPSTHVEGCSEDTIQEAKKTRVREMEMKLLESQQLLKSEMNASWLGSLINTIIGNLKLSITNVHIRYEDLESNPGHPFAAGVSLHRLSAVTVDDNGVETFATGGALERIQKSVELECLALYFDSNCYPWRVEKPWQDMLPSEWIQMFEVGQKDGKYNKIHAEDHSYILQPVSGNARYMKLQANESKRTGKPLQKAVVNLNDVTLCLSKDGYRDMLKLADNFNAFNQRLKYAHYRPPVPVKVDPRSWWKYAYKVVVDDMKKASGKFSWDQVLKYARLRKKYVTLYASLLKSDANLVVVDDNEDIGKLDHELDIEVILQWRMLAHKFLEQSTESDVRFSKEKANRSWWSFGWGGSKDESEPKGFTDEDWERLNKMIGYKEDSGEQILTTQSRGDLLLSLFEIHMKHNASKLSTDGHRCLAELSCDGMDFSLKIYPETKNFDFKLGSYRLSSLYGLLAESATISDSLVGMFSYKPFNSEMDWSFAAKASPCYMTYLKDSVDEIISFFKSSTAISQTIALETAAAVQMTLDEVRRTAQQQVTRALKDHTRFSLDLDIAAPKITIPTKFFPDEFNETKLLLDLGNLMLSTKDYWDQDSHDEKDIYLQFNMVLSDVSAFLVDGNYSWNKKPHTWPSSSQSTSSSFLPVIDQCMIVLKLQQIQSENPFYPSMRVSVRLPSLGFYFSPARYHRLMKVVKIFEEESDKGEEIVRPWSNADIEGWASILSWKGMANREAIWQRRYLCLAGPFLYVLESPASRTYKQYLSLRGKQVLQVPVEFTEDVDNVLAVSESTHYSTKVLEDVNALILKFDTDESRKTWQNRFQAAIYRASGSAAVASLSEISTPDGGKQESSGMMIASNLDAEKLFVTGVLDELRICFSCGYQNNQSFTDILLAREDRLFEFRATGGQVELSSKGNDLFIGTVLKSLEIEDQFLCERFTMTRYLARSFVMSTDDTTVSAFSSAISEEQNARNSRRSQIDTEEQFFEASDSLVDPVAYPESQESIYAFGLQSPLATARLSIKPPSFKRIAGLLADATLQVENKDLEIANNIDSFVKAQVVFYHQDSPLYSSIDKRVSIMLATLSFFCHRPTILAILQFVNAINYEEDRRDTQDDRYSANQINNSGNDAVDNNNINSEGVKEPVVKGLLGRGKSRAIFYLTLSMAKAQIFLVNENGSCLATLSENNFRTDIKVFPSSFNINAALGNLKISDDSLPNGHSYFWVCNMRNPGGSSFVELDFSSFSVEDDDYQGYDYSLVGQFSEVRIVYLNRFVQEIISYFTGLVPGNSNRVVKLKDQSSNSERLFTTNEIEGSPALKLDVSLSKPIIVMPRRTDSPDYLELDVVHITVGNTFHWVGGDKNDMSAAHLEMMTIQVQEINLSVGTGDISGENIIEDVKGLSIVIQRSLRDLLHQIPLTDAVIKVEELRAALSNREYQIIKECSVSNMSETPRTVPPLDLGFGGSADTLDDSKVSSTSNSILESVERIEWISMKASVAINLVELCLYSGSTRDMPLATIQAIGASLLYKANSSGESFIWATLKGFTVIDDREGTRDEFRHTIGKHENRSHLPLPYTVIGNGQALSDSVKEVTEKHDNEAILTMLILDVMFKKASTSVSLCIQRPHLLVALDFLMATAEFFVPTVRTYLSEEGDEDPLHMSGAIILDKSIYTQPSSDFFLSPRKPLIVDDERFDHYIYDGNGGNLYLKDSQGIDISCDCAETIVFVGNGKRLQFRNLFIKNGEYLDSCIFLGSNSSYSVSEDDNVFLERGGKCGVVDSTNERMEQMATPRHVSDKPVEMEYLIELQAIGPELTFYNSSKDVSESLLLSNKVLHAELDVFCRLALKGDSTEITGDMLGLKVESNGIRVLEPFDTSVKFSNISGRTNINIAVSDIFMNFSYSMMMLFLAVEEDILAFIRMTAKKVSVTCSQFDKVGTIINNGGGQTCAFWRPRTPPGFAVLGDCLTPLNEPPSKGVLAVNTSFVRVKRPVSYKLIWPPLGANDACYKQDVQGSNVASAVNGCTSHACSIWFPVAPPGYVAVGCVVSAGRAEPPLSSTMCILSSLVSPCSLRDCISLQVNESYSANLACWRVENSFGSFLVTDSSTLKLHGKAYELRQLFLGKSDLSAKAATMPDFSNNPSSLDQSDQLQRSSLLSAGRLFEAVASFKLIWWNQGSPSPKKLSIWRPVVPPGMFYFGDIAVQGYEPPNACFVLHDSSDDTLLKPPPDFRLVGQIRRQRRMDSISFWLPQAPSGYVPLGCIATRGSPKLDDFNSLRCIRSDMVTGDQFPEESIWETSDPKMSKEPFSIWSVGNEVGTFIVRRGFRKPPKRFALRLADLSVSSRSDNMVVDAQIKTLSAAIYDDYSGLMVPLFNVSLSGIGFSMRGRSDYLNSTVNFSLAARSYNDKYDSWEPLIEPIDGFLRYQYDLNSPGAVSQLRLSSTRDLNLNISTSNMNMILQAYSSWNSFSHIHESYKSREIVPPSNASKSVVDLQHKRDYYIIPQNKLGQEIYVRPTELKRYSAIIKMQSGENKPIKVPVSKNLLDSHLEGKLNIVQRSLLTIVIFAAELPAAEGLSHGQYTAAVRLFPNQPSYSTIQQQSARTSSAASERFLASGLCSVNWNEMFFFRVDLLGYYMLELIVTDLGTGQPIGFYSSPLENIALKFRPGSDLSDVVSKWTWRELSSPKSTSHQRFRDVEACGRIKCAVFLPSKPVHKELTPSSETRSKPGFIQISPSKEGPWTTVRLNYATPAACWRLGNDVVASELTVINGTRYVNIRSLVSVTNSTEFVIELRLKSRESNEKRISVENRNEHDKDTDSTIYETDMFFEIEKYVPAIGWVNSSSKMPISMDITMQSSQGGLLLPSGWEWIDDWHIDNSSVNNADGWVYAPDIEHLRWPESVNHEKTRSTARQRKWIRHRKYTLSSERDQMPLCLLKPGDTKPLPLQALVHPVLSYILQLRPTNVSDQHQYSWSMVKMEYGKAEGSNNVEEPSEFCLSALNESEIFMYCSEIDGNASNKICGLWYRLSIEAVEIGKDMHLDPIQDWKIIVDSPLSITNYLPLSAEYSILTKLNGQFLTCFQRNLLPGENVKVYRVDLQEPLYVSLQLQGWEPMHESVLISHPHKAPSRAASLTSSFSGRVIQIIFEQDQENVYMMGHHLRVYVPYWIASARCPPLKYKFMDISKRKDRRSLISVDSVKNDEAVLWQITEEEMVGGCTIASAISFKHLGLSVSMGVVGKEHFGPIIDLSPLGDMDGSLDTYAYDADGKSFRIFISSKPCPYPAVPTKVITVRPFLTFANRTGQDLLLKLSANDDPKVLYAHDSRISFTSLVAEVSNSLQVQMKDMEWSYPIEIINEDTFTIMLRKQNGGRGFLRVEIRVYEEGFLVVFRLGTSNGLIRVENRIAGKTIGIRQSGLDDDAWMQLEFFSSTDFSWENPYGSKTLDVCFDNDLNHYVEISLENSSESSRQLSAQMILLHILEVGEIKVARFTSLREALGPLSSGYRGSPMQDEVRRDISPMELIIELGVVGVSLVDHKPRELLFLYLERVFISYSTGYDAGATSRFKLIVGQLQLDNQLPLTVMPVLLAPENITDMSHPVFKTTITMRNQSTEGTQIYPYVYVRVTDTCWRLNIHEPIIWALAELYNNIHLDRLSGSSDVIQVDPEIRIDLIDVSEIRLKLSLETAPTQRPHGVLGIWSPILSAVGNALKIQIHLRKVMHRNRFMRKSSIIPSVLSRIRRDLIHDPLHLIFSVDVLGMTKSTFASLSKGFAELSTDGQFLQLRSKQVWSRRITGVSDGILQGTEALAQGVAFGVSGVVRKPLESARQHGMLGFARGLGHAFLGFIVQPVSGALDFVSLTVDGISASFARCLEILSNKATVQRIRNPRAIRANGVLKEYDEKEAVGQMILYLAEASRHLGCTDLFKEPSKFAWSDYYEDHFNVPFHRILLVTNKRIMLLQCLAPDKMDKRPCKIIWDVPWEELLALELAKAGYPKPSHLIIHIKNFKKPETFVRLIKCSTAEEESEEPQAVRICSAVRKMWRAKLLDMKTLILKVPSSQRHVQFACEEADERDSIKRTKPVLKPRELASAHSGCENRRFIMHIVNFQKIWSSELETKSHCTLCPKQVRDDGTKCSIWRPSCPDGYISVGDIARIGIHPPNVASVYRDSVGMFASPLGYDLVWRNCLDDYAAPVSVWHPRAPEGFVSVGCVAVASFEEPHPGSVYCVSLRIAEETAFENQAVWTAPDSYPWACYFYQVQSEALHFIALRQRKEQSDWKPMRVSSCQSQQLVDAEERVNDQTAQGENISES